MESYYVAHDLVVPEEDSLVIEPGCELLFRYEDFEDYRLRLTCYGTIVAEGSEVDSIWFTMVENETQDNGWHGVNIINSTDTSRFSFTSFSYGNENISGDSAIAVIRNGLKLLVNKEEGFKIVGEAKNINDIFNILHIKDCWG